MTGFAAGVAPNMLPRFFFELIGLGDPGRKVSLRPPWPVVQANVDVAHRHAEVAVGSQFTGFEENIGCEISSVLS